MMKLLYVDNRDSNTTWIRVADTDGNEQTVELNKEETLRILASFYENMSESSDEQCRELKKLIDWVMELVLECGYDYDGSSVNPMEQK
jgi:hypothetical protein